MKFTVGCTAAYRSSLILPDDIDMKDTDSVVEYIREHLSECNVESEFQWLGDMEPEAAVTAEDII